MDNKVCKNCQQPIENEANTCSNCDSSVHVECSSFCLECSACLCDECALDSKFLCSNCLPEPEHKFEFIRRSHLELYKICPYAFYLECVKEIPTVNNVYAETGIIVHDVLDKHTTDKNKYTHEWMVDEFKKHYFPLMEHDDFKNREELYQKLYVTGINSINNFMKINDIMPEPIDTEKELFFNLGKEYPKIRITADRINPHPEGIELVDYKTGRVHVGKKLASDLQISTYAIAAEEHYNKRVMSFRLLFLSEEKTRDYERVSDTEFLCKVRNREYIVDLEEHKKELRSILGSIRDCKFSIKPDVNPYYCINLCQFGKNKICEGSAVERWRRVSNETNKK